jgi:hypothetical protein
MTVRLRYERSRSSRTNAYELKAVTPLLHKHAPGLVHGMLAASYAVTPCEFPKRKMTSK